MGRGEGLSDHPSDLSTVYLRPSFRTVLSNIQTSVSLTCCGRICIYKIGLGPRDVVIPHQNGKKTESRSSNCAKYFF